MTKVELLTIEEGWTMQVFKMEIIPGVARLKVYDNKDACLTLGRNEIYFDWSADAQQAFDDIDVIDPISLITILSQCSTKF